MMLVLSGEKGRGKTSLLKELFIGLDIPVQGFLSLKEVSAGTVTGISLLILPEHRSVPMATTSPIATQVSTGRFYFYPQVFDLVNTHFQEITPDLPFVFDEFGPLEMEKKGHYPIFASLEKTRHRSILVVRSELLADFLGSLSRDIDHVLIDLEKCARREALEGIRAFIAGSYWNGG